jgi:hypothetical protein
VGRDLHLDAPDHRPRFCRMNLHHAVDVGEFGLGVVDCETSPSSFVLLDDADSNHFDVFPELRSGHGRRSGRHLLLGVSTRQRAGPLGRGRLLRSLGSGTR